MSKFVLSINAGSSSLKFELFKMPEEECILSGQFDGKRTALTHFRVKRDNNHPEEVSGGWDYDAAVDFLVNYLIENDLIGSAADIACIGHRVAHGGEYYAEPVIVDSQVKSTILALSKLAPIHNPINLLCIEAFEVSFPGIIQVAVFDTAFHQSLTEEQYLYPLPYTLYEEHGIRRYGFHGISHQYVSTAVIRYSHLVQPLKVISCHLGSGASICAIEGGQSKATTMGYTPLAGLMMGTRCGDIDPSLPLYLVQHMSMSANDVSFMLNNASGLLGISELSDDCRLLESASIQGDHKSHLSLQMFANRIIETIGGYAGLLNGFDVLVFTGGIGENSSYIRKKVTDSLSYLGVDISEENNNRNDPVISNENSTVKVMVINTNEQLMIAREACKLVSSPTSSY